MNATKKLGFTILTIISVAIWALLIWQYFHNGVPSHSFMAREDMPEISNWWGALLLPLLTYFSLYRIQKRLLLTDETNTIVFKKLQSVLWLFVAGLVYAGTMAYCFVTDNSVINGILFPSLFLLGLIFPLYKAEFFLGFVIGMTYTFGAILPTFIESIVVTISFIAHKYVYPFVLKLLKKKG